MYKVMKDDLKERIPISDDYFNSSEICRQYDVNIRTSTIVPMGKATTALSSFCSEGSRILGVGSRTGMFAIRLGGLNPGTDIIGIEENEKLLEISDENTALITLANSPASVELQYGSFEDLPFEDNSMDVVFSYASLHSWKNPVKTLQEIDRVCKPEGLVYIYEMARDADKSLIAFVLGYISKGHEDFIRELKASYTVNEIKKLLDEAGMGHWIVTREEVNMAITNRKLKSGI